MTFKNDEAKAKWEKGWNLNDDPYGRACYRYAKAWAEMMEKRISGGSPLEGIAKETSHEADTEGITGFMYGMAVSILSGLWIHGERLRKWHNIDTQIKDEEEKANEKGTVLNPATLVINDGK
jgi:hypothetical protein